MTHNRRGMKSAAPRASRRRGGEWGGGVSLSTPSCPRGPSAGWVAVPFLPFPLHREGGFPRRPRFFSRTCRGGGTGGTGRVSSRSCKIPHPPPGELPLLAGVPGIFQALIN